MEYLPVILAWVPVAVIIAPFVVPKLFDFLLSRSSERFKLKLNQSQKAEKISELFSYMPFILDGWTPNFEQALHINKLILELSLYLPRDLVDELSQTLCLRHKSAEYKNCFIKIRSHLLGGMDDGLIGENISHISLSGISFSPIENKSTPCIPSPLETRSLQSPSLEHSNQSGLERE